MRIFSEVWNRDEDGYSEGSNRRILREVRSR